MTEQLCAGATAPPAWWQCCAPDMIRRPFAALAIACLVCLAPFANKAFHIDDPLFLWGARQVRERPLDYYGFRVHWSFSAERMAEVTKNPPLTCYYLALLTGAFGENEVALHLGFLLWPVLLTWGTYRLAQRLGSPPLLAALATLFTPVVMVSATNVMCDVMMTSLWVWALVWWDRGLVRRSRSALLGAALLAGLCALTKYYGMCLIPLFVVHGLARRGVGAWMWAVSTPVAMLVAYQLATRALYGHGLLSDAAAYASWIREHMHVQADAGVELRRGLDFMGGCLAGLLFFLPILMRGREFACLAGAGFVVLVARAILNAGTPENASAWGTLLTETVDLVAGALVLLLAVRDLVYQRDPGRWLLFTWIVGTFVFGAVVNWSVNGRSFLPMAPAVAVVLGRALARGPLRCVRAAVPFWPLVPAAALSLLVTWGDYRLADSARTAATLIHANFGHRGRPVWFEGHWGFQYYMERLGERPTELALHADTDGRLAMDVPQSRLRPGDLIAIPSNNSCVLRPPPGSGHVILAFAVPTAGFVATMNPLARAGFYSHLQGGPLPFSFGPSVPEFYLVYQVDAPTLLPPPSMLIGGSGRWRAKT